METAQIISLEHKKLKTILNTISEGVIITNQDRNIIEVNRAAQKLTGFGETEMIDNFVGKFVKLFEEDKVIHVDEFCPVLDIDLSIDGDMLNRKGLRLIDKNNETKVVDFVSHKMKEGTEADVGCMLIITDTAHELELERMKLDFVSMTAHVLRTPVTILRGYSSMLMKPETIARLNEQEITAINEISTAAGDLALQIENLLKFAEISSGKINIQALPIDLESLVTGVVNDYREKAKYKGLTLNYIPPVDRLPPANADVIRLKEVLARLLDNALQYTEEGHVDVGVLQDKEMLVVVVKDSGRGIASENIPHLFEKFYRVKSALQMETGRGMSLHICKRIMDAMHGEIGVESKIGEGSSFFIKLPIAEKRQV